MKNIRHKKSHGELAKTTKLAMLKLMPSTLKSRQTFLIHLVRDICDAA